MSSSLRVLIVDDSQKDAQRIVRELERAGYELSFARVDAPEAFTAALAERTWDAVVAECSLPQFDGLAALQFMQNRGVDLPFIVVSRTAGEGAAVATLRAGAHDYVLKDNLAELGRAMRRELREAEGRRAQRAAEAALRRRAALLEALQQVGLELTAQLDLETLLHSIVSRAIELLDGTSGGLYLHRPAQDVLEWTLGIGPALPHVGSVIHPGEGLCGKVWESGVPLVVNDYKRWDGRSEVFDELPNVASVGVLVRSGDESLGVLNVLADLSHPFTTADAEVLTLFANQAAIAIRNARLYEAAQARSRYLETMHRINATLRSTLPLREVLNTTVEATGEALGYSGCAIALPDATGERLVLAAGWAGNLVDSSFRTDGLEIDGFCVPLSAGANPVVRAFVDGELETWSPHEDSVLEDVEPRLDPESRSVIHRTLPASLAACVPLPGVEGMVGVLAAYSPRGQLPEEERAMLLGLADQAGLAIENARLYEEARRRAERLAAVNHVARAVGATLHLDDLLETVYQEIDSIFESDAFFIGLFDEEHDELDFRVQVDEGIRQPPERHSVGNGLTSLVVSRKKPLLIRDLRRELASLPEPMLWGTMKLPASWLGVPMQLGTQLVGVICVQAYAAHAYDEEDQLLLSTIADQIAVAVVQARLYHTLRASEERYRALFEQAQDAVFLETLDGRILDVNERACQLLQYEREELLEMTVADLVPPEVERMLPQIIEQELAEMGARIETENVRKDGSRVAVEVSTALLDLGGENLVLAIVRDVTERKMAEHEIAARQRYLEGVLASAPDAIVTLDARHRIVEWNQGAETLFGYTSQEVIGRDIDPLITNDEVRAEAVDLTQVVLGGDPVHPREVVRYRKDGSPVDVIAAGSPILEGDELIGVVAVYTDISERKRAERLLQALNEAALAVERALTLEAIFTAVGHEFAKLGFFCGIFGLDKEERTRLTLRYLNYEPEAIRSAEELVGFQATGLEVPVESVDAFQEAVGQERSVLADGRAVLQQVLPASVGSLSEHLADLMQVGASICAPLLVEEEVHGLLVVQSDDLTEDDLPAITAFAHQMAAAWRKAELLQDLEASLAELKHTQAQFLQAQKMEAVGRLAGGVAHDLNNMLTVIQFGTQLIERQLREDDPLWEHVSHIREAGERAAKLTKHLLIFSRREVVEPRVVDLSGLVRDLSRMLRRIIGEDIELVTALSEPLWPVKVDPSQIEQAIVNLVVNARDAMPRGGRLTIETANTELDDVYAARHIDLDPGDYAVLTVSDNGLGMSEEVKAHLFEPFFTTKERGKGTGLGLATVFGIMKRHQGHVLVESELGRGSTFRLYLPRVDAVEVERPAPSRDKVPKVSKGTETILVVEDDADVRDLAAQILETQGYRVLTAENGHDALRISEELETAIDLLLTDLVLPRMNGRELAQRLEAQQSAVRVLYMTGYGDRLIADHGVLDGSVAVLSKPFTMETLLHKVRSRLDAGM